MNFNDVYDKYYNQILKYCFAKLNNRYLAEECTQEVFLVFYRKMDKLKLSTNVPAWLYKTAALEIRHTMRKNRKDILSLDEIDNVSQPDSEDNNIFDGILTDEEIELLTKYYDKSENSKEIAKHYKISYSALRQKIKRLKDKLRKNNAI